MEDFFVLFDYLKKMATDTNAGRASIDFTTMDGSVFRIEYKPAKRKE